MSAAAPQHPHVIGGELSLRGDIRGDVESGRDGGEVLLRDNRSNAILAVPTLRGLPRDSAGENASAACVLIVIGKCRIVHTNTCHDAKVIVGERSHHGIFIKMCFSEYEYSHAIAALHWSFLPFQKFHFLQKNQHGCTRKHYHSNNISKSLHLCQ